MAAGDIKGEEAVVEYITYGATVTKGQLLNYQTDQKFDPCAVDGTGPFAVAVEAGVDTDVKKAVTEGRVEVEFYGATAAKIGTPLMASAATGKVAVATAAGLGKVCGMAAEAMDTSGSTYTMWILRGGA